MGLFIWLILNTALLVLLIIFVCMCMCCRKTKKEQIDSIEKERKRREKETHSYNNLCPTCQRETGAGTSRGMQRTYFSIRDTPKALPRSLSIPGTSSSTPLGSLRKK